MNRVASNRSNLIARMLFVTAASAIAFSAAACAVEDQVETEDDVTAVQQEFRSGAATGVISAPPPAPVPVTCVLPSPLGSVKDVTEEQCKKLLSIAGCPKAGAVVNDKMKCSTTG
ncbi:MAG TPA: hypothetical protein VM580_21695 [Labilithrix sp.]|nr:hypothetical protein [Labilithrix sp.]